LSDAFCASSGTNGERNLLNALVEHRDLPVEKILDKIFHAAERAVLNVPPDDRTAVVVRG
jgi:hypothetical protein